MSLTTLLGYLGYALLTLVMVLWWLRSRRRGLEFVVVALLAAFAISYLSSLLVEVKPYRVGCLGICNGWRGYPIATHIVEPGGLARLDVGGFVRNAGLYFLVLLSYGAVVLQLAHIWRWSQRRKRWRLVFLLLMALPWLYGPSWAPTPQPPLPADAQRLAINAQRDWTWQFRAGHFFERALAVEDVRQHPDGTRARVCFRAYSWLFIPSHHVYVDLEPAGVRATAGGSFPLSASCWVQP